MLTIIVNKKHTICTMESTLQSFQHTMKMIVFNQLKTNDPFIDAILTTLVFTAMAKIVHYFNTQFDCNYRKIQDTCLYYLYTSNKITISGKNCTVPSSYGEFYVSSVYSDCFNAVLQYIIHNTNNSIHDLWKYWLQYLQRSWFNCLFSISFSHTLQR